MNLYCLGCDHAIDLGVELAVGQHIICPECETELEIINLNPVELDWIYDGPVADIGGVGLYDDDWWENPSSSDEYRAASKF